MIGIRRDLPYLRWRFSAKPGVHYFYHECRDEDGLRGIVVSAAVDKHGGRIGYIMELLHHQADREAGRTLLASAVEDLRSDGADAVLAWNMAHSPNHHAFRRMGFLPMPGWLRPIELHFGVRSFRPELVSILTRRDDWYLSYADSDTV